MSADEHEGMQFVEGHGWLPVVTMTPTEQARVVVYDRPNPYLIEIGGDSTSPWSAWDEGWTAHEQSLPSIPAAAEILLYGHPGDEVLYLDPTEVHEREGWIRDDWDLKPDTNHPGINVPVIPDDFTYVIEEWSTQLPSAHMRDADDELERIVERVCDNGLIDEDASDQWYEASREPDVVAAMQAALDLLASKISYRMADNHLRDLTVSFDDNGEPLLDGEPMYVTRPREDI